MDSAQRAAPRRRLAAGRNVGPCVPRRTWWVRWMIQGQRFTEGYATEQEANVRRDQISALITLGGDPRRPVVTKTRFKDVVTDALRSYQGTRSLRPATVENHRIAVERHLLPYFGEYIVDADHFDRAAIRKFIIHLRGGDGTPRILADSSIKVMLPTLSLVLDHCVEAKLLLQNPLRGSGALWRAEQPGEDIIDPFTPDELKKIIRGAYEVDPDFGVLVQIVAQCGLRPGEGLGLRRCDVDIAKAEVNVRGSFSRRRMGPTKTRSSTRSVSLTDHVVVDEALSRSIIPRIKAMKITTMDPEERLFPLTAVQYWPRRWKRSLDKAGVRYRKPHMLRHTFASVLLSRGENILEVQEAGGWRSATVLLTTYAKWIKAAKRDGASNIASNRVNLRRV